MGDSHGALLAVKQTLNRAFFNEKEDLLISLGDVVDGFSQSAELVQFFIELSERCVHKPIFLLGNHDKWCKDWLTNGQIHKIWQQQGGQATIDSYIRTGYLVKESHRNFFKACNLYYIDEQNRGFVHGGYNSRKGLGHETYESDYYWDRDLWNLALISHSSVNEMPNLVKDGMSSNLRFLRHKEVFIGHTSTNNWNVKPHYDEYHDPNQAKQGLITVPMNRCNVWNLDTGCGFSGKLTIMDVDTKEYFQSDFVKELYPNEHGRN